MDVFMWKSSINEVFSIATFHHRRPEWLWPISPWWNFGQAPQKAYPVCSFLFIAMLSSHVCSHVYVHRLHPYLLLLLLLAQMHIIITYHHYISSLHIYNIYIYIHDNSLYADLRDPRYSYGPTLRQTLPSFLRRLRATSRALRRPTVSLDANGHEVPGSHGFPWITIG